MVVDEDLDEIECETQPSNWLMDTDKYDFTE
jgi:hypothetical protein